MRKFIFELCLFIFLFMGASLIYKQIDMPEIIGLCILFALIVIDYIIGFFTRIKKLENITFPFTLGCLFTFLYQYTNNLFVSALGTLIVSTARAFLCVPIQKVFEIFSTTDEKEKISCLNILKENKINCTLKTQVVIFPNETGYMIYTIYVKSKDLKLAQDLLSPLMPEFENNIVSQNPAENSNRKS